jgi:hypothetical protein
MGKSLRSDLARVPALLADFVKAAAQIAVALFPNIRRNNCLELSFLRNSVVKGNRHDEGDGRRASL